MSKAIAATGACVIESHEATGVEWGVSLCGSNPTPDLYLPCRDAEEARCLLVRVMSAPDTCWFCGEQNDGDAEECSGCGESPWQHPEEESSDE